MSIWEALRLFSRKPGKSRRSRRNGRPTRKIGKSRDLRFERFEDRVLLSINPQLLAVIPNEGDTLAQGKVLHIAPQELVFRFDDGQQIDPTSLGGIQIVRAGGDDRFDNGNEVNIQFGYIGVLQQPNQNEVVARFKETLPEDRYLITISSALKNIDGLPFDNTRSPVQLPLDFQLDVGPQITAVVPQPVTRGSDGKLQQANNQIEVYFSEAMDVTSAPNAQFYRLIATNDTADPRDDVVTPPSSVTYVAAENKAVLVFAQDLSSLLPAGTHSFRLRIGESYQSFDTQTLSASDLSSDAGDTYATARVLEGSLDKFGSATTPQSMIVNGVIETKPYDLQWPGSPDDPGHRLLPEQVDVGTTGAQADSHYDYGSYSNFSTTGTTDDPGVSTFYYNFQDIYGTDSRGNPLHNVITAAQQQDAREIFELFSKYCGVQFVESDNQGFTIATGDLAALGGVSGVPGGDLGMAGVTPAGVHLAVMDGNVDWGNSEFGGRWFTTAMGTLGMLLGLGHTNDLPAQTIEGYNANLGTGEGIFPGLEDLVHLRNLYRPDSTDIDLYKFTVSTAGTFSAETIAQRLSDPSLSISESSSLLNSELVLFQQDSGGKYQAMARNDDYFGKDSYLQLFLQPGTYYVGVSASGNDQYDPAIPDSGVGGTTQGPYDLRVNFTPKITDSNKHLVDATKTELDGDADGTAGGVYHFWFNAPGSTNKSIFVDKSAPSGGSGTLASPYNAIPAALAAAQAGDIVRIVGNNFANDDPANPSTLTDNLPYEIGTDLFGNPLPDGSKLEIPRGVTVMIDAGAVLKLRGANIDLGSSAIGIDRSGGALQVLGTPAHSVYFTSDFDETIGRDNNPLVTTPSPGDWGGLVFRSDLDHAYNAGNPVVPRADAEKQGIFLNYVNHADMRFGGGQVTVTSVRGIYDPIYMAETRVTASFNTITRSADAAMSADPNSYLESKFEGNESPSIYTAEYDRVGPELHANRVLSNSINGVLVRIRTDAGKPLDKLTVPARFSDRDIVYVVPENLVIAGSAGGPLQVKGTCPLEDGNFNRIIVPDPVPAWPTNPLPAYPYTDGQYFSLSDGAKTVRFEFDLLNNGVAPGNVAVALNTLQNPLVSGAQLAPVIIDAINTSGLNITAAATGNIITLTGTDPSAVVSTQGLYGQQARLPARLAIDPGVVVKLGGSRIETEMSAELIAEGTAQRPVIFTSLEDDRYGAGGTFDGTNDGFTPPPSTAANAPKPGDWGGLYFAPASLGSIDHALIVGGGGRTTIEGSSGLFNAIEIHQAQVRLTNSTLVNNAAAGDGDRNGRGPTTAGTIFVRGAQPVIVNNIIRDNSKNADGTTNTSPAINIDVNSLTSDVVPDWGRATGPIDNFTQYGDNHGALVRLNKLGTDGLNGMLVRGGALTTQSIWDDTDIVHIVQSEIISSNQHTYGGLRLQSSDQESLVVKLSGSSAGLTATGTALEITDRIGGTVQIVGMPGHPVVLTALADDSVGAGFDPAGQPQNDTDNTPSSAAQPGAWRSVKFDKYSNDRNVAVVNEAEQAYGNDPSNDNGAAATAQNLGQLAATDKGGDNNLRLGFEVHGQIRSDNPSDVDSYSFQAASGTEVWLDVNLTTFALDTVIELVDANGNMIARSNNSVQEADDPSLLGGTGVYQMQADPWHGQDFYTYNPRDAGMRVVLPGPAGQVRPYYVRVYSGLGISVPLAIAGIDAAEVPDVAALDTQTFQITAGASQEVRKSITFEFVDLDTAGRQAAPDHTAINFYASKATINDIRTAMVYAINGAVLDATAQAMPDGTIALVGLNVAFDRGTTPLKQALLSNVDATTFKITDGSNRAITFEFVDLDTAGRQAAAGHTAINFHASTASINDIRTAMADAINAANFGCKGQVRPDGSIALDGAKVVLEAGTMPFAPLGRTAGEYQLQVRLRETAEIPGSTVQYADIRYATDGVEILGMPTHSPLLADTVDLGSNNSFATAQDIGNLLASDQGTITVAGHLSSISDVNWYKFQVSYADIHNPALTASTFATIFDVNYADGMGRPDVVLWVFDSTGRLIYMADGSNIVDDRPDPTKGSDLADLSRGSVGANDPYLGPVQLNEGPSQTYYVAITGKGMTASALQNSLARREPIDAINRVAEDHIGLTDGAHGTSSTDGSLVANQQTQSLNVRANPFNLGDVTLYVLTDYRLFTANAFTGAYETSVTGLVNTPWLPDTTADPWFTYGDIGMRQDGNLYSVTREGLGTNNTNNQVQYRQLDTGDARTYVTTTWDDIAVFDLNGAALRAQAGDGISLEGMTEIPYLPRGTNNPSVFVVGHHDVWRSYGNATPSDTSPFPYPEDPALQNLLYVLNVSGTAIDYNFNQANVHRDRLGTDYIPLANLDTTAYGGGWITGMAFVGGQLYCVSDRGALFEIMNYYTWNFLPLNSGTGGATVDTIMANPLNDGAQLRYIGRIPDAQNSARGAAFNGLTAGPPDVELDPMTGVGKYADMLFGVDAMGQLYAFDTQGTQQPVFLDGNTSIQLTGIGGYPLSDWGSYGINSSNGNFDGGVTGVAFSNIDYNLWHETNRRGSVATADAGHGITPTEDNSRTAQDIIYTPVSGGHTSMYFGLEDPRQIVTIAYQPNAAYYRWFNSADYQTYNMPNGAHGSLITDPFSLVGYTAADRPTVSFNYYLDAGSPQNVLYAYFDEARVFVSGDDANWTMLKELTGSSSGWLQQSLDLSAFAGKPDVRLRFDFSTTADLHIGDVAPSGVGMQTNLNDMGLLGGAFLSAIPGDQLHDGDYMIVANDDGSRQPNGNLQTKFEFDLGGVLAIPPGAAGAKIPDTQQFTIVDGSNVSATFEFDTAGNGLTNSSYMAITLQATDSPLDVAAKISAAIQGSGLTGITTMTSGNLVEISKAQSLSAPTTVPGVLTGVTRENGGPGVASGNVAIDVTLDMTADEVAQAVAEALRGFYTPSGAGDAAVIDPGMPKLLHMYGHKLVPVQYTPGTGQPIYGPLPYANSMKDAYGMDADHPEFPNPGPYAFVNNLNPATDDRFHDFRSGQDNSHEGFYIDDVIVGFAERGEMVTGTTANNNPGFVPVNRPTQPATYPSTPISPVPRWSGDDGSLPAMSTTEYAALVPAGDYTLQIRRAPQYGQISYPPNYDRSNFIDRKLILSPTEYPPFSGRSFDTNDRLTNGITLQAPSAATIYSGQTLTIDYEARTSTSKTFEYVLQGLAPGASHVPIYYKGVEDAAGMAALIAQAINGAATSGFGVTAASTPTSDRVDLFGASWVTDGSQSDFIASRSSLPDDIAFTAPWPNQFHGPQTFSISAWSSTLRAITTRTFEYALQQSPPLPPGPLPNGNWAIYYDINNNPPQMALLIAQAINAAGLSMGAWADGESGQVHLSGATSIQGIGVTAVSTPLSSEPKNITLEAPLARALAQSQSFAQQTFSIYAWSPPPFDTITANGANALGQFTTQTFEFVPQGSTPTGSNWPVYYDPTDSAAQMALNIAQAINAQAADLSFTGGHSVSAWADGVSSRVNLSGAVSVSGIGTILVFNEDLAGKIPGDSNSVRDQGQILIDSNKITYSQNWGISVGPGTRESGSNLPHPSAVATLSQANAQRLVGGITIQNNVVAFGGSGGIRFQGVSNVDPMGAALPLAAVPFGRIVNNTVYGSAGFARQGTGILVQQNASPTLLNNIVANLATGVSVDATSTAAGTVVGGTAYQNNTTDILGVTLESFPLRLSPTDPLFVNAASGDFYPAEYSPVIDSSVDSLQDRTAMVTLEAPLGIPPSPILAPDADMLGQLRADDARVAPPAGMGRNIFKDRGAIDRVDFAGPTAQLVQPLDNDPGGVDKDPTVNNVSIAGQTVTQFAVHLLDPNGTRIDDNSVNRSMVTVSRDGAPLTEGLDYTYAYDATNDIIYLRAPAMWAGNHNYSVALNNGLSGIRDIAGNLLLPNRPTGTTEFLIHLGTGGPTNTAPTIDGTATPQLSIVPKNLKSPPGDTVAFIVGNTITDADDPGAMKGIAISATTGTANGTWEFWLSNGTSWRGITGVSDTAALLLRDTDKVRFVPNTDFVGSATITYHAWDQTDGIAGQTADVSPGKTGGHTAYSTGVQTATVQVMVVPNTAPLLDNSVKFSLTSIVSGDPNNPGTLVTTLLASTGANRITDPDSGALQGIAVVGVTNAHGHWQYSLDNGATWFEFGGPAATSARLLAADGATRIHFVPLGSFSGTVDPGITFRAWDQTTGTNGATADTTQNGGSTAFSTATATAAITVNPPPRGDGIGVFKSGYWALDRNYDLRWGAADGGTLTFGWDGATPVVGDWNGDGNTEIGVYSNGVWWLDTNANGMWDRTEAFFYYGWQGATAVVGDWNGDGTDDVGVYNLGVWFRDVNGNRTWDGPDQNSLVFFGWDGATPVPGKWKGNKQDQVGVYSNGAWLRDANGDNQWDSNNPDELVYYGWNAPGVTPVVGDWNGDGKDDVGIYANWAWLRDVNGNSQWDAADKAAVTWFGNNGNGRPVVGNGTSMPFPVAGKWATAALPLLAAEPAPTASAHSPALSSAALRPIVTEAIARWSAAGLSAPALEALSRVQFVIADLPGSYLGKAEGSRITLDRDAAGHGWFIDPTPKQDEEFVSAGLFHGKQAVDPRAVDRIDLLTVVEHELGHIAGLRDLAPSVDDLMSQRLGTGMRRTPDQADVEAVFALGKTWN